MSSKIIGYLKLTRPLNILMIVYVQVMIKYVVFGSTQLVGSLNDLQFSLLVLATALIAAAGNVVNDIFDVNVDNINKPQKVIVGKRIPEKAAYNYYIVLNILGVGIGFYLANSIGKPGLAAIFIVISALLYSYATYIKALLLVGNLLVSVLVAMSLLVLVLFDIYPALDPINRASQLEVTQIIVLYAGFAFFINLIREIVKDVEDMDGDKNGDRNSLAIALGRKRTISVVFVMGVIALVSILMFANAFLHQFKTSTLLYFIFGIGAPLLYFCIQAWNAKSKHHFSKLSTILKIVMITGIASLFFISEMIPAT